MTYEKKTYFSHKNNISNSNQEEQSSLNLNIRGKNAVVYQILNFRSSSA